MGRTEDTTSDRRRRSRAEIEQAIEYRAEQIERLKSRGLDRVGAYGADWIMIAPADVAKLLDTIRDLEMEAERP